MTIEGEVELKYLQNRIDGWARRFPELTRKALIRGADKLKRSVLANMRRKLRRRTGHLMSAINRRVIRVGDRIDAEVFAEPGHGGIQAVKLRALERGSYRTVPGGVPFLIIGGRARFISKDRAEALAARGKVLPITKKNYGARIRPRPMFGPALRKDRPYVIRQILAEIINGYPRVRS